ncbi:MAG: RNB domain-containing ribonuclease [Proteobacteria bacterium]|nr:RNB domain-containing ribonuclease [Pseudomonadota bacterium]
MRSSGSGCRAPDEVTPDHLRDLLQKIGDRPDAGLRSRTAVIRTMPQAVYQPGNIGHFGLALDHYAHFTSPIRRYPDLVVHRGIRQVLREGDPQQLIEWHGQFPVLGQDCSFRERRADEATRSAVAQLKCFYAGPRRRFDGIVSGVVDFGLFVQLDGLQVDEVAARLRAGRRLLRPRQFGLPHDRPQLGQDLQARRSRAGARDERLARRPARGFRTRW